MLCNDCEDATLIAGQRRFGSDEAVDGGVSARSFAAAHALPQIGGHFSLIQLECVADPAEAVTDDAHFVPGATKDPRRSSTQAGERGGA